MSAANTDYFTKISDPGSATNLAAPGHSIGGTSITVDSTTGWPTDTGVIFAIDTFSTVNGTDVRDVGSYTVWEGVVSSGTTITSMTLRYGTDQDYTAGPSTRVYILPTSTRENRTVTGLLISHKQTGAMIDSLPLTTPQITTSINDTNGNEIIKTPATTSAVNEITVTNAATGNAPKVSATGGDTNINLNLQGKGTGSVQINGTDVLQGYDYVVSGCVWTADAAGSTRVASMTSGVVCIGGNFLTVAAVTSRTFTASKDVYVDVTDNGDGTGLLTYTDNTTNAASPALTGLRLAIIVVGASNIATAASINQGQQDRVLPIASSIPYQVTDSLGNLICNRTPNPVVIGYRQITGNVSTSSTTAAALTGLSAPVIIPTNRKVKITVFSYSVTNSANAVQSTEIHDGAISGTTNQIGGGDQYTQTTPITGGSHLVSVMVQASGSHTYNASGRTSTGTATWNAKAQSPAYILVELV